MKPINHVFAAAALGLLSIQAQSAVVFGDDVKFTYDDSTLYGTAMTVGNSIFFLPTNFRAESNDGSPLTDSVPQTLNITVEVINPNYEITSFELAEAGDYFLDGAGAEVTASGRLQVSSNTTLCGILPCIASSTFDVTGLNVQGVTTDWSSGTSIDLLSEWGADTEVVAQIQNNLSASTATVGETAWIQKKAQLVGLEVTVVPVPAAVWLFISALGLTGFFRRKTV